MNIPVPARPVRLSSERLTLTALARLLLVAPAAVPEMES